VRGLSTTQLHTRQHHSQCRSQEVNLGANHKRQFLQDCVDYSSAISGNMNPSRPRKITMELKNYLRLLDLLRSCLGQPTPTVSIADLSLSFGLDVFKSDFSQLQETFLKKYSETLSAAERSHFDPQKALYTAAFFLSCLESIGVG
jgi:hypothetical protein